MIAADATFADVYSKRFTINDEEFAYACALLDTWGEDITVEVDLTLLDLGAGETLEACCPPSITPMTPFSHSK